MYFECFHAFAGLPPLQLSQVFSLGIRGTQPADSFQNFHLGHLSPTSHNACGFSNASGYLTMVFFTTFYEYLPAFFPNIVSFFKDFGSKISPQNEELQSNNMKKTTTKGLRLWLNRCFLAPFPPLPIWKSLLSSSPAIFSRWTFFAWHFFFWTHQLKVLNPK